MRREGSGCGGHVCAVSRYTLREVELNAMLGYKQEMENGQKELKIEKEKHQEARDAIALLQRRLADVSTLVGSPIN